MCIGLGDRIDLVGIDRSRTGLAEIAGLRCRVAVSMLCPPVIRQSRAVARTTGGGEAAVSRSRRDTAPLVQRIAGQQRDDRSATGQRQRIFEQRVEQFGFRFRRRGGGGNPRLFRRFGPAAPAGAGGATGGSTGLAGSAAPAAAWPLPAVPLAPARAAARRIGFRLRRLLHVGQHPVSFLEQFLQVVSPVLEHRQARSCASFRAVLGQALGLPGGRCRRQVGTRANLDLVLATARPAAAFRSPGP